MPALGSRQHPYVPLILIDSRENQGVNMSTLVLHPTSTAQWQALVSEAQVAAACQLDENMESHLVFLLMRFATSPDLASRMIAIDYLESMLWSGSDRHQQLRDVGDHCLLLSGLFAERAGSRQVGVSYYINIGRSAYHQLSEHLQRGIAEVYAEASHYFVALRDVLHAMRELDANYPCMAPILAHELWHENGSHYARQSLQRMTGNQCYPYKGPDSKQ